MVATSMTAPACLPISAPYVEVEIRNSAMLSILGKVLVVEPDVSSVFGPPSSSQLLYCSRLPLKEMLMLAVIPTCEASNPLSGDAPATSRANAVKFRPFSSRF